MNMICEAAHVTNGYDFMLMLAGMVLAGFVIWMMFRSV